MKILEISTARIWGGGETYLRALCFGLIRCGHDVLVACLPGTPVGRTLGADGLRVLPLGDARGLARLAVANRIDVIHAHQSKGARLAVAARYLSGRSRVVLTRHALGPPEDTTPKIGLSRLIAVSHAVARDCRAAGFPAELVAVIHNGVDTDHFRPNLPAVPCWRLGLPATARAIVLSARLSAEKGTALAVKALLPLLARVGLHLLLLGDGDQRSDLERLARQACARDRVLLLGHQPDVRPFLALAEVVVAPGPREAFGLAVLEAMAMGCAVVAVEAGGVPEVMADGQDGLLVPPGDGLALAAAVYRLVSDAQLRQRLGQAARQRALDFTLDKTIDATEAVLAGAVRGASPVEPPGATHRNSAYVGLPPDRTRSRLPLR